MAYKILALEKKSDYFKQIRLEIQLLMSQNTAINTLLMAPDEDEIYQVSDSSIWLSIELIAVFLFLCLFNYERRFISIKIYFRYIKQKS